MPRDAINIGAIAAQEADGAAISVPVIRRSARRWYVRDKEKAVESRPTSLELLHWVMDEVIGSRRARAFLLQQGGPTSLASDLIGDLYDSRVLHVIKRSVSAHDQPGVRFTVYALDYGCYVELISTANGPKGLLPADEQFIEVPPDDYRSIRRAILNLAEFETRRVAR